jgi:hypothetical protein
VIAQLIRREPLWMVATGIVLAALWGGLIPAEAHQPAAVALLPALLLAARNNQRATLFDAALPIPGQTLFTARLLFLLAAICLPVCASAGLLLARAQTEAAAEFCASGMVITAAAVFAMTSRIEEFESSVPRAVFFAVAVIAVFVPPFWGVQATAIVLLGAGLLAAGRLMVVWPQIPAGFQAAPIEARPARVERQALAHGGGRPIGILPLFRAAMPRLVLIMLLVIALQGLLGSWIYGVVAGFGVPGMARRSSRWLWGLPISRRTLLAITIVPYLACMAGSFAVGAWLRLFYRGSETPVVMYDDNTRNVECWRFARGPAAPVVQAPWGETAHPEGTRFLGWVAYNPFVAMPRSSPQFVEWQFLRATEAIYGRPIPSAEYRKIDRRTLRPLSLQWRAVVMNTALIFAVAMFGIGGFTLFEWRPFARLSKTGQTVLGGVGILAAFGPVLSFDLMGLAGGAHLGSNVVVAVAALRLSAYPWLAVPIVAAAYALLQWQFAGVEAGKHVNTIGARLIDQRGI